MTNNHIQVFDFDGYQIRTIIRENGEPWFVANDVCKVLDIVKYRNAIARLEADERGPLLVDTLGGRQEMTGINESGLYSLILTSRKSEAKKFKKWVTSEVLPSIRKNGYYGQELNLDDPKLLQKLLIDYSDRVIKLEHAIELNEPKICFYDSFMRADGLYNLQNAARALNQRPNLFIRSLKQNYLFYQNNELVPYQRYIQQGIFEVKSNLINEKAGYQTYITPKGLQYFAGKLGIEPKKEIELGNQYPTILN